MPLYEFRCRACSQLTEVLAPFDAPRIYGCRWCGGNAERIISVPGPPAFRGPGFYSTDSKEEK